MGFHVFEAPPLPPSDNRVRRGYYTRRKLCDAVKQVMLGAMTVTQAARHFKIPRTTIQKHFSKAREQHTLRELHTLRMEAAEQGVPLRIPGNLKLKEEPAEACLLSYGVDLWPNESTREGAVMHWTQQPVQVKSVQVQRCINEHRTYSYGHELDIAEECEVACVDPEFSEATAREEKPATLTSEGGCLPAATLRPLTRVVLRREGSNEIVKQCSSMSARKAVKTLIKPELYPLYLYKRILRLHCGLPAPARLMGDTYVRDEFRRHKNAGPEYASVFINEWTEYCVTLSKQLSSSGIVKGFIGKDLEPEMLDNFAEEQLRQLLDLKLESDRMKGLDTAEASKSSEQTN